jgi:hypothetical protein
MYYISTNREELELYAMLVEKGERYDGRFTVKWANIIKHKDENLYAILKHDKYPAELETLQDLNGWFDSELI